MNKRKVRSAVSATAGLLVLTVINRILCTVHVCLAVNCGSSPAPLTSRLDKVCNGTINGKTEATHLCSVLDVTDGVTYYKLV